MTMITLTIDGAGCSAEKGMTILEVARANGVHIPTLCYHAGVESWGGCRLCMVEITKPAWEGWTKLVTACLYPVEPDLIVRTDTPEVFEVRRMVLELLMARCPNSSVIRDLAREYGVVTTELVPDDRPADNCILCTLCVRACAAVGADAIGTARRGIEKELSTPLGEPPPDCIGCTSCARVCPTHTIKVERGPGWLKIWGRRFELLRCPDCGKEYMTPEERDHHAAKAGLPVDYFAKCEECRRADTGRRFADVLGMTSS
jgi:NADH dehydrogenase/NADH:ubiquinone oxidoreductase subunit G